MYTRKLKNRIQASLIYRVFRFRHEPIVLTDAYGIRFVYYPWDHVAIEKHLSRRNYIAEFEAMKKLVKPGDTVLDVGANIGLHSVLFDRLVGEKGRVYSFEPVPETVQLLRETLALNKAGRVTVITKALSDKVGMSKMNTFDKKHSVWNSLGYPVYEGIRPTTSIDIDTITLDAFCDEHDIERIDFLKLDVEGYERFVLEGARRMLESGRIRALSFEISEIPLSGSGVKGQEIFDILGRAGYKIYSYDVRKGIFEGPIKGSDTFYDNYFALHEIQDAK